MNITDPVLLNTPVKYIPNLEFKLIDLIQNYCYEIDKKIAMLLLFMLFMYIADYIIIPHLKNFYPDRKALLDRINNMFNSFGLMSIIYMLYIVYEQVGFSTSQWFVIGIIGLIIIVGTLINIFKGKNKFELV